MKALITGASSGLGRSASILLSQKGYDLILVARNKERLEEVKKECSSNVRIIPTDISSTTNCVALYHELKDEKIDLLINSAGVGSFGFFEETDLNKDLQLIDLNIKALHTLTKLFLQKMEEQKSGAILNIASTASFSPGPLMATYYASKAYVLRFTEAVYQELKEKKSPVYICCLCPGPVNTHFNDELKIKFKKAQTPDEVMCYAFHEMKKKKMVIIPTMEHKLNAFFNRFVPMKLLLKANYNVQIKKLKNKENESK